MKKLSFKFVIAALGLVLVVSAWTNPSLDEFKRQRKLDGKVSRTLAESIFQKEENRGWGEALINLGLNALSKNVMKVQACRQNFILFSKYYITLGAPNEDEGETHFLTAYGFLGKVWPLEDKEQVEDVPMLRCEEMEL